MTNGLAFDVAHLLAGGLVLVSFLLLYQDRMYALLRVFAVHAFVLALSVAWQAYIQDAPHLYVTAGIALVFKAIIIPVVLHRMIIRLGIHREIEKVVGVGTAMLAGIGLVALSMVVMLRVTAEADPLAREDLAFALSVVLLGLLMMVTRRNAVSQVVGFMSLENGLVLAAAGAKGMPLVVEISPDVAPVQVLLDKRRIERILANLLENARTHGHGAIRVGASRSGEWLRIEVDDAGPGGLGRYTLHTTLLPARPGLTWTAGMRAKGVDYAYLARRADSARREEVEYGLAVELLAIGAEFVYDNDRLAAALQSAGSVRR